jgi:hypothetical protein
MRKRQVVEALASAARNIKERIPLAPESREAFEMAASYVWDIAKKLDVVTEVLEERDFGTS